MLISIGGWLGWTLFSLVWLIAIVGIVYKSLTLHKQETVKNISTIIYIVLGWLCIIAARPLYESLGFTGTALLVAGVCLTLGAAFYSLKMCGLCMWFGICSSCLQRSSCIFLFSLYVITAEHDAQSIVFFYKSLYYKGLFFFSNYFNIN